MSPPQDFKSCASASSATPAWNGWRWIRTTEAICSRFTVCPLWPLGNPSIKILSRIICKSWQVIFIPYCYPKINIFFIILLNCRLMQDFLGTPLVSSVPGREHVRNARVPKNCFENAYRTSRAQNSPCRAQTCCARLAGIFSLFQGTLSISP